jgi:hypothetical protein
MPPEMRVRFNAVAGERRVWPLTGNTLFPREHNDATSDDLLCEQCSPDSFSVRSLEALEGATKRL